MTRLAERATRPRTIDEWAALAVTLLVLVACPLFVLLALHPSKLLLDTTPAGGDMGAHVWAPAFLKSHLFGHGRLSGWAPDWYNGFPALTYYFPGPYVVIALLSYVVPYGVAFKVISVCGVVSLPLAAYAFGRLTGMKFPGPVLLAVATVPFLFDRYFTIWGGNIASTLAGEFAFSISLSLALVFIGVFATSLRTGRYRALAAGLLAATLLCHLLPTFFAIAGALVVWVLQPTRRRLATAVVIACTGLAITAWWLLPFAARLGYSNDMGWERTTGFMKGLFPFLCNSAKTDVNVNCPGFTVVHAYTDHLRVVVGLAAAGVVGGLALRRRTSLVIAGLGLIFAGAFRLMPQGTLWNARMLPFWYLTLYLAAAACVADVAMAAGILLGRRSHGPPSGPVPSDEFELTALPAAPPLQLVGAGVGAARLSGLSGDGVSGGEPRAQGAPWWSVPGGDEQSPPDVRGVDLGSDGDPSNGGSLDSFSSAGRRSDNAGGGPSSDGPGDDGASPGGPPDGATGGDAGAFRANRWPEVVVPVLAAALVLAFVGQSIPDYAAATRLLLRNASIGGSSQRANPNFVSGWANWNYSGYERKASYPEFADVVSTMTRVGADIGCGRALWEYEPEEDRFGTPMALMLLPKYTDGCIGSEEGLFFESSATVPYHFLDQSELSQTASRAMRALPYRNLDLANGIAHLQLLGVRYYMAISPTAQAAADALTGGDAPPLTLVATTSAHQVSYAGGATTGTQTRTWRVYEVADSAPVVPLSFLPAVVHGAPTRGEWNKLSVAWYQDRSRWSVPLAASGPTSWPRVDRRVSEPHVAVVPAVVTDIVTSDDRISFDVDRPGVPVLVKTSYFPNWQAIGANGPWRVTPNLMVVVPTGRHVELHYGFTPVDNAGRLITVSGLAVAAGLWRRDRRPGAGDDATGGPTAADGDSDGDSDGAFDGAFDGDETDVAQLHPGEHARR